MHLDGRQTLEQRLATVRELLLQSDRQRTPQARISQGSWAVCDTRDQWDDWTQWWDFTDF